MNVQGKLAHIETICEKRQIIKEHLSAYAHTHNVPCISSSTEQWITQYLMKYKPVNCLEIGSAIGYSTQLIATHIEQRGGSLISCEISHPSYMIAIYHQRLAQIYNTTIYHTDFLNLPIDRLITQQLDMVFIDAMKAHYHLFLERILPYCKPGATIICDDVIAFADKVNPLFVTINEHSLAYKQIKLDDGDGLLVITV